MMRALLPALVLVACDAGTRTAPPPPAPTRPPGELTLRFGTSPDDTTVVHPDGSFGIVIPEFKNHLAACATGPDGICPRHVDACTVTENLAHCPKVELTKAADGTVDIFHLVDLTIATDGAVVYNHARFVIAASGLVLPELAQHLPTSFLPPPFGELEITGATTPELRRRAMLVMLVAVVTRMSIPGIPFPD